LKLRHWINLIGIGLAAALLTFLAVNWAITSYAEPTCRRYAESHGMTYVGFTPPDPDISSAHEVMDGNCQLRASNGEAQTVSLVKAGGASYGAPLLVSLALKWTLVFGVSFVGVALILAMVTRAFTPKKAAP
jgi:hypothetical protein